MHANRSLLLPTPCVDACYVNYKNKCVFLQFKTTRIILQETIEAPWSFQGKYLTIE